MAQLTVFSWAELFFGVAGGAVAKLLLPAFMFAVK